MKCINRYYAFGEKTKFTFRSFIKLSIFFVYTPICSLIFLFVHKKSKQKKYKVSITAIFKNEAQYLKEWIVYHQLIGVEHFYLYNNFSEDNYLEILSSFISEGSVTLIDWPIKYGQKAAYTNSIESYSSQSNWIAFIDIDEFICLKHNRYIIDFLNKYKNYPSIMVNWKMFGSSGLVQRDEKRLVVEQFDSSWEHYCDVGKSFVNTSFKFKECKSPHYFIANLLYIPVPAVDEYKRFTLYWHYWLDPLMRDSEIQINHYWSKSYSDFMYKDSVRGSANTSDGDTLRKENVQKRFDYHETMNTTKDYTIQRFLILLKNKITGRQ